jgi:hypothetical protein
MLIYVLLAIACLLSGVGALTVLGLSRNMSGALLAAPGVGLMLFVMLVGNGLWFGAHVTTLAAVALGIVFLLGLIGVVELVRSPPDRRDWLVTGAAALCPFVVLAPSFYWGLTDFPGSWFWDGWSYIANAQYFLDRFAVPPTDPSLIHIYGEDFRQRQIRYITYGLIALLSTLVKGVDAHAGYGPFLAIAVFVFATSCGFFALTRGQTAAAPRHGLVVVYVLFAGTAGWILAVVQANNLDSFLLLAFGALLSGFVSSAVWMSVRGGLIIGATVAAMLWSQVELFPIALLPAVVQVIQQALSRAPHWREFARWSAAALVTFLVTVSVWIVPSILFFQRQWQVANRDPSIPRPGINYFRGLFDAKCATSSAWGMWGPFEPCTPPLLVNTALLYSALLTLLLIVGAVHLVRKRDYAIPLATGLLIAGAVYMIWGKAYDYGAYKFLSSAWYLAALLVVEGVAVAAAAVPRIPAGYLAAVLLLFPQAIGIYSRHQKFEIANPVKSMSYFRQASQIRSLVGDASLIVAMNEYRYALWFVLVTRDMHVVPARIPHGYIRRLELNPLVQERRRQAIGKIHWVATDRNGDLSCRDFALVWEGGPYRLWKSEQPSSIFAERLRSTSIVAQDLPELKCDGR